MTVWYTIDVMKDVSDIKLRVLDIIDGTIVDGPGLRTSIYLAGCRHECQGCHNPQSWDFNGGKDMTIAEILNHVEYNGFNVTLSGGDPLYQVDAATALCNELRKRDVTVWVYTGFTYEHILANEKLSQILSVADVLVDGPFIEAKRDTSLLFRGSSNQRLIDLHKSRGPNIVEWENL